MTKTAKTAAKTKAKCRVLGAVLGTAADLHRLGLIDKRRIGRYEALCMEPIAPYDSNKSARCAPT